MNSKIVIGVLLFLISSFYTKSQVVESFDSNIWVKNITQAKVLAIEKKVPILLVFSGSDWCIPCMKLKKQILLTDTFSNYAKEHFVLLNLDFPRKSKNKLPTDQQAHNDQLASIYNNQGFFPLVVIINSDGVFLASTGFLDISPAEYILHIEELLNKK